MAQQDAWRAYYELALGLTETSRKKAMKIAQRVVDKGGATAEQLQALADDLISAGTANREAMSRMVKVELDRALGRVGLATMDEVNDLTKRVRELETDLRAAGSAPGASAPAGSAPAGGGATVAKKAVAKKTVAKKTVAKRAAPAKTAEPAPVAPAARAKKAAPAKTAVVKRAPAKKAPAKTATATPTAAKKAVAKKAPAKKTTAKSTATKAATRTAGGGSS